MEELELTYLVKALPDDILNSPSKELLDIYLPSQSVHPVLRVRKSGNKYEITKKEPININDASRQLETTIPLTEEEFEEFNTLQGKRVQKTRYYYKEGGITHEVDVFQGDLSGLVIADVEFTTMEEKEKFKMPSWCLSEVTQEKFLAGGMLCGKKYSDIENNLNKYNYQKIQ